MDLVEAFRRIEMPRGDDEDPVRQEAAVVIDGELRRVVRWVPCGQFEVDDVVNVALLKIARRKPGRRYQDFGEAQVRGYLARCLRRTVISAWRRLAARPPTVSIEDLGPGREGLEPGPATSSPAPPTDEQIEDAWRLVTVELAGDARRRGTAGDHFDRDFALLVSIKRGGASRKVVIRQEHQSALEAGNTSDTLAKAANRVDRRLSRARQALVEPAFLVLREAGWFATQEFMALAHVLLELGLTPDAFEEMAARAVGSEAPVSPARRRQGNPS
jgi:DNA-directed RNA polymerase specialized sigma24 family protein